MPTTSDYLTQLQQDRDDLVDNLEAKGITGLTGDETFTELVPEVLNIPSGGGGISEYINGTINTNYQKFSSQNIVKLPPITITRDVTAMFNTFAGLETLGINTIEFSSDTDTSNCTAFNTAFNGLSNLTTLDLSTWDTSSASGAAAFYRVFFGCKNLRHLDIRNFTFPSGAGFDQMMGVTLSGNYVPYNCEIIVKSQTEKDWFATNFSDYTNVKTVAEYEAEQNS